MSPQQQADENAASTGLPSSFEGFHPLAVSMGATAAAGAAPPLGVLVDRGQLTMGESSGGPQEPPPVCMHSHRRLAD